MQPREIAQRLERRREVRPGRGERFVGYGLSGLRFAAGEVVAFHRHTASSIGPPFTSVWQRTPDERWIFHTNVDPTRSCPRYFGPALDETRMDDIEVVWLAPREVSISARRARLKLALRLAASPATIAATFALTAGARLLPRRVWHSRRIGRVLGAGGDRLLRAGRLPLGGTVPAGQRFQSRPHAVWLVETAAAVLDGRDLGPVVAIDDGTGVGDFLIASRGLFTFSETEFDSCPAPPVPPRDTLLNQMLRTGNAAL